MFTFALAFFLQAIDISFFIFNLFLLFAEGGRRNLEESIHNENHWPQLLHVSGVECQIDRSACFTAYFSSFPNENQCISKSWSKLMNYKPENRIPWLSPDLEKFLFFPDISLAVTTLKIFQMIITQCRWQWRNETKS